LTLAARSENVRSHGRRRPTHDRRRPVRSSDRCRCSLRPGSPAHDVLSGYGTDPEGEIQQGAFQAGFIRTDGFSFLLFVIIQFHLGIEVTPIADAQTVLFDVRKVLPAAERGAACRDDLSAHWDHWALAELPLDEARARLGIPPLSA